MPVARPHRLAGRWCAWRSGVAALLVVAAAALSGCGGEPTTKLGVQYTKGQALSVVIPACGPSKINDLEIRAPDGTLLYQIHPLTSTVKLPVTATVGPSTGGFHTATALPLADIESRYGTQPLQIAMEEGGTSHWHVTLADLAGDGSLVQVGEGAPVPVSGDDPVAALGQAQCAATSQHDSAVRWATIGGVVAVAAVAIFFGIRSRKRWNKVLETLRS